MGRAPRPDRDPTPLTTQPPEGEAHCLDPAEAATLRAPSNATETARPPAVSSPNVVSRPHDPANPLDHGMSAEGAQATPPSLAEDTCVLTRRQKVLLDKILGGSQPQAVVPSFVQTLLIQTGPHPENIREARASTDAANWEKAIQTELNAMDVLEVWHLAFLPAGS